jgi:hypothetical protein
LKRPVKPYIVEPLRELAALGLPEPRPFFLIEHPLLNSPKESRRSAYGKQAGAKHSGHIPEHDTQGQNPHHGLSDQRRQADG